MIDKFKRQQKQKEIKNKSKEIKFYKEALVAFGLIMICITIFYIIAFVMQK